MTEVKAQKIFVFVTLNDTDKNLVFSGIRLALILGKELCLCFHHRSPRVLKSPAVKAKLTASVLAIKNELPDLKISTLTISKSLFSVPAKLADEQEAILFVASAQKFSKYAGAVAESPVPFMFINENNNSVPEFKRLLLPIDMRKEISDSAFWSSYFARFNKAEVVAIAANDKEKEAQKQVKMNLLFTKKLFAKFNLNLKIYQGEGSSFKNSFEALQTVDDLQADLIVLLGSTVVTPIDWLVGLPEKKIIKKAGDLPVLLVNARVDNYILCD